MTIQSPIGDRQVNDLALLAPDNGKAIGWSGGTIANLAIPPRNTARQFRLVQHFQSIVGMSATVPLSGDMPFYSAVAGTGAAVSQSTSQDLGTLGVINLSTGTTATGSAGIIARSTTTSPSTLIAINTGDTYTLDFRLRLPILTATGQNFGVNTGFMSNTTSPTDAVYIAINSTNSSVFGVTIANGVTSSVDLGFTPTANVWYEWSITYTPTLCSFAIGGQSATISTNIPTGANNRRLGYGAVALKTTGTTARTFNLDFMAIEGSLA